ncbi:MAG TPA: NUDIX hydrolase [Chthoniobacterales bacterium]
MKISNVVRETSGWETISSETHYTNSHMELVTDRVRTPSHFEPRNWTIVHRKAAVVIAPITADGKLVLIRQERIPIRAAIWEIPAGQIDETLCPEKEAIKAVALRELREETGYELAPDGELIALGHYFSSPGFTDEHGYFFLAQPVVKSSDGPARNTTEAILDCRAFSPDTLRQLIADNEIRDANTLSMCAQLIARGLLFAGGGY